VSVGTVEIVPLCGKSDIFLFQADRSVL